MFQMVSYSDILESLRHIIQLHISTNFSVTGWMLCVNTHILKDAKYNSGSDNKKQDNNITLKTNYGLSEDKMDFTQYLFWSEYTLFGNKNGLIDGDGFIWKSKEIRDGNSHLWYQKYSLP